MKHLFKRGITFALVFTVIVTMCFGSIGTVEAHAADTSENIALSVYDGNQLVKEYTLDDLKVIAAAEGDLEYKYSGYNRNPSFAIYEGEMGPTVEGILADAGVTFDKTDLIKFVATDQADATFVADELFRDRFYYPNGAEGTAMGAKAPDEAYDGAEKVPAILAYFEDGGWIDLNLRFGQVAPNEQNRAASMQCMNGGKIIVRCDEVQTWDSVTEANYTGGEILPETELVFALPQSLANKKVQVYFTDDNGEPGFGDAIYNYDRWGSFQQIVLPSREGTVTYKFKVIGYGKLDSEVTTFTYEVVDVVLDKPNQFMVIADEESATLVWSPVENADGYEILRYNTETDKCESYSEVTGADNCTYTDTAVEQGKEYSYQVRAYKTLSSGQRAIGSAAGKQTVTVPVPAPPAVAKPALNSAVKTGYGGIQIKWSKVTGTDGYEVWRYDAVTKKWAKVKTFTDNSTVSWKNTGLKTGRKYTYKVRAYVNYNDEKVYGSFSGTKAAAPALNKPVISKVIPASRAITVKWNKVPGANGYKIYRSTTGKAGSFKVVKTIKKGGTVSWKNTKLKKGQKYYYKVKAYRIVDKKYVYSSISLSKYTKSK